MLLSVADVCYAQLSQNTVKDIQNTTDLAGVKSGMSVGATISGTVSVVIRAFLALLALIFVVLIIVAGFNWMTAGGDESKVTHAKETIQRAIIGLIIIVAAYSITYFIFHVIPFGDSSGGGADVYSY